MPQPYNLPPNLKDAEHIKKILADPKEESTPQLNGGFPKLEVTFLGVLITRTLIFGVHIGVPLFIEATKRFLAAARMQAENNTCAGGLFALLQV